MRFPTHLAPLLAAAVIPGCGEERATPERPAATPSPAATPEPAGAGDEEGIEQGAGFAIGRDGEIFPPEVEVTAFLPVRLTLSNEGAAPVEVDLSSLEQGTVSVAAGDAREIALAGPGPGRHAIRSGGRQAVLVAVAGG